ncbi:MAG: glycosyltransferase [Anaerolineales bacterium]
MLNKPKMLIFTSKTGGGHISLSDALQDLLTQDCEVQTLDPQPAFIHWHYRTVSRHALWLWALEFRLIDGKRRAQLAHAVASRTLYPHIADALQQAQPDAVLTTYPFLTREVTYAMHRSNRVVPFGMLFADPNGVHHTWLTETNAQLALAPTREVYQQARTHGFNEAQLYLSGWLVRQQFLQTPPPRAETLRALGLQPERFTVFLQGGGEGAARFAATVENVLTNPQVQVILAAGTNQALLQRFGNTPRLAALGFTREIARYMAAADVVMGKAGPNMLMEAVALGKPLIATAYIPGQEFANLAFIRRHQLGWVALTAQAQRDLLQNLVEDETTLAAMRVPVEAYRAWNLACSAGVRDRVMQLFTR